MVTQILFFVSLGSMVGLVTSKWFSLQTGRQSVFSRYLSQFDGRCAYALHLVTTEGIKQGRFAKHALTSAAHEIRVSTTTLLHELLQAAERRVRAWREMARERQFDRPGTPRAFIRDVVQYKSQLRQTPRVSKS